MSKVEYRTGTLWGVLAALLLAGTLGAAYFVYGITVFWNGGAWWTGALAVAVGLPVAAFSFLLLAGILYRVDRIRGVVRRRVELFE